MTGQCGNRGSEPAQTRIVESKDHNLGGRGLRGYRIIFVLLSLLATFLIVACFIPLGATVQIGADEGFELAKTTLCLKGHHLYTEVWNDQPPLHTFLITQILKHISPSIVGPRLLTIAFSVLLLAAIFALALRVSGLLVAAITASLLLASPGFLELSSSCMLEIPALATAVAALCLIAAGHETRGFSLEILCGVLFASSLEIKLVPMIYLPLVPLILFLKPTREEPAVKNLVVRLAFFGTSLLAAFIGIDLLIDHGAYLAHFQQSWTSHFAPAKSLEYGSAGQHPFQWSILLKNWDVTVAALAGLAVLIAGTGSRSPAVLPLAWLALSFLVFGLHKPWWPYYYIHMAIPLCWCAGIGAAFFIERSRRNRTLMAALSVFALCALSWMGARVYLQVANLRRSPQILSTPVIAQMKRYQHVATCLYADKLIYSFHSGIPVVPSLAVVPIKRMWSGEMTNARLAAELQAYKPGLIALLNDGRSVPFEELLAKEYQLVYMDSENRLYALKGIAHKASRLEE